ncbi:MAG: AI-2E family transporter [Solirubrobacterales bacterium]
MNRERATGVPRWLLAAGGISWRLIVLAAALALVGYVVVRLRVVVVPVVIALFLTSVLYRPAAWLRGKGLPNALAAVGVVLAAVGLVVAVVLIVAPSVSGQFGNIGSAAQDGVRQVGTSLADTPLGLSRAEVDKTINNGINQVREQSGSLARGLVSGAAFFLELLGGLTLALVLTVFFIKDGEMMWRWLVGRIPRGQRDTVRQMGQSGWDVLSSYLSGIAIVATVDAVLIGVALAIIGVPLVVPLAVLTFVAAFFPIIGAFFAGLVATLVALVTKGGLAAALVFGAIAIVQQIDGNLLNPIVVGRALNLHPVVILLAVTGGGVLAGVVGALFAVPLTAVAYTVASIALGADEEDDGDGPGGLTAPVPAAAAAPDG